MWETIRGYLTFTRKERFGVLFLLLLIGVLFILPYIFRPPVGTPDPEVYEKMKEGILKFESKDSVAKKGSLYTNGQKQLSAALHEERAPQLTGMFYFDPNEIQTEDWKRLGLSQRLAETIRRYIGKGGRFRQPEDLKKLYGLRASDYERISPFVRIAQSKHPAGTPLYHPLETPVYIPNSGMGKGPEGVRKKLTPTDINQADTSQWALLPGIGSKLAARIVRFREKLGGFYEIQQVGETFGLPDSTFQKIRAVLVYNGDPPAQIDLNNAPMELLQLHPYIRWQLAKAIVEYRLQHGPFHSVEVLMQLTQIDSAQYQKIRPYVFVKP